MLADILLGETHANVGQAGLNARKRLPETYMNRSLCLHVLFPIEALPVDVRFGEAGRLDAANVAGALKTALLYADSVICVSLASLSIQYIPELWLQAAQAGGPGTGEPEEQERVRERFERLLEDFRGGNLEARERVRAGAGTALAKAPQDVERLPSQWGWLGGPEAREIDIALMSGYVTNGLDIDDLKKTGFSTTYLEKVFANALESTVLLPEPLVQTADPSSLCATVAAQMLRRLPQFTSASMDEVLDIREELKPYLTPFRAGVADIAAMVRERDMVSSLAKEIDFEMQRTVEPVLQEIEGTVEANRYLRRLAENVAGKDLVIAGGGGLGAGIAAAAGLGGAVAASAASVIGSALGAGSLLAKTAFDVARESRKIKGSRFYLYYRLKRRWPT